MKLDMIKFYVAAIISGLVLLAAVVLVVLQWGNDADLSLYGANKRLNTALLMVLSAVGGLLIAWLARVLWRSVAGIRRLRRPPAGPPEGPIA